MIDPTSVELHFADHEGPERATKVFSILVRAGMVLSGLWLGETALSATFGGQIREEFERIDTDEVLAIQGDARQEAVL